MFFNDPQKKERISDNMNALYNELFMNAISYRNFIVILQSSLMPHNLKTDITCRLLIDSTFQFIK